VSLSNDPKELLYPSLLLLLGYIIPWTIILFILAIISRHVVSTRRRHLQLEQASLKRSQALGTSVILQHSASWSNWLGGSSPLPCEEVQFYLLSSVLLLLYIVLLVPHVLCVNIPPLIATQTVEDSTVPNKSSIPELSAVLTGTYDCIFVWCRYKFTLLVPIFILILHKEVRKKCQHMFCCCCCRNNTVVPLDTPRSISARVEKRAQLPAQEFDPKNKGVTRKTNSCKKDKYTTISHYTTPVLFATSEGLHLRFVDARVESSYSFNDTDIGGRGSAGSTEECWNLEPHFSCEFCDVALIVSTPTDSVGNPHLQHSVRRESRPAVFGEQTLAEGDIEVSDNVTGDSGQLIRRGNEHEEFLLAANSKMNNRNIYTKPKATRVRFAQTVSEIPLSESGVWSAPEDQAFVEHSALLTQDEPQNIALNELKLTRRVIVPSRHRMAKSS
jgi:hypothetical protein